ncbi:MAG: response regulator transcription factor [Actinobacteria bacterium]|nr:response regulator transcription factor [Actinomycetota bacterium]
MIRVLVADDQSVVRSGLRMILDAQGDIEVIGEASDGEEAIAQVEAVHPDVVLMDIRMPSVDGIEATRRITGGTAPPKVLVLTTYGLDENVYAALKAGASGFLLKTDSPEELIRAVRVVASGDSLLGPSTTQRLIERFLSEPSPNPPATPELDRLTAREAEVLENMARGLSNREIAEKLYVSEGTVKTHVAHILAKLDCRDRVQAVVFAYESGLIQRGAARPPG